MVHLFGTIGVSEPVRPNLVSQQRSHPSRGSSTHQALILLPSALSPPQPGGSGRRGAHGCGSHPGRAAEPRRKARPHARTHARTLGRRGERRRTAAGRAAPSAPGDLLLLARRCRERKASRSERKWGLRGDAAGQRRREAQTHAPSSFRPLSMTPR